MSSMVHALALAVRLPGGGVLCTQCFANSWTTVRGGAPVLVAWQLVQAAQDTTAMGLYLQVATENLMLSISGHRAGVTSQVLGS